MKKNEKMLVRNSNKIFKIMESSCYILDDSSENLISLNETGMELWVALEKKRTKAQLLEILMEKFDVNSDILTQDIDDFLVEMKKLDLVNTE